VAAAASQSTRDTRNRFASIRHQVLNESLRIDELAVASALPRYPNPRPGHVLCPADIWTPSPKSGVGCTDIPPSASSADRRGRAADVAQAMHGP
jgi:hypothetical protein